MKKSYLFLCAFLFTICGFLLIGCGGKKSTKSGPPPSKLTIEHFPTEVGNWWEYKLTYYTVLYDTTFDHILEEELIIDTIHGEFLQIDTLRGWECYVYNGGSGQRFPLVNGWYAHPDTALLVIATSLDPPDDPGFCDPPGKVFVFPLTIGTYWVSGEVQELGLVGTMEAVAEESVHVPGGDFSTLKLEARSSGWHNDNRHQIWISDQGIIKDSMYLDTLAVYGSGNQKLGYYEGYTKYELLDHSLMRVKHRASENGKNDSDKDDTSVISCARQVP
jgi:hypothetical protein